VGRFLTLRPSGLADKGFFGARLKPPASGGPKTWTQLITGLESLNQAFFSLDFVNSQFVIGAAGTQVFVSPDAATWTLHTVSGFGPPNGVTFGAGTYVIVLNNSPQPHVASSPDLATWTAHTAGYPASSETLWKPVFGLGVFLTASQNTARYSTSPDGATWTLRSTYVPNRWGQPIFDGTRFLAPVLNGSNVPKIVTSTDGITWTEQLSLTAAFNASSTPYLLGNNGTTQYLAGESLDDAGNNVNGALTTASAISYNTSGISTLVQPVYSGTSWARMDGEGTGVSCLSSSSDGITWFLDSVPAGLFGGTDLAFGLGKFLGLGFDVTMSHLFMVTRGP
jgi:hypothetical protein